MLFTLFMTSLPVGIGLFLKLYSPIDKWLEANGNYQILIWAILTTLFLCEIFGRSYIFNKEKVKNGWSYLIVVLSFRFKKYKSDEIRTLIEKYMENPAANTF